VAYSTKNDGKIWLFLHACCAPCSSAVLERLAKMYQIILFFYNPNIMPREEYEKRLAEQRRLAAILDVELIEGDYDCDFELTSPCCEKCIAQRLFKTAELASARGFDYFTTTLSVSPHKNTELINKLLTEAGALHSVTPLLEDFKKKDGFKRSVELSKMYGLYRQKYCGCVFQKNEKNT
jgi:hypothetical protein